MREIEARAIATGSTTIAEVRLVAHLTIPTVAEAEETLQDGGRPSSDDNPVTRLFRKWFGDGSATGSSDSSDDVGGDAGPSEAYRREEKVKFIDLQCALCMPAWWHGAVVACGAAVQCKPAYRVLTWRWSGACSVAWLVAWSMRPPPSTPMQ